MNFRNSPLPAPQATLMASVSKSIFTGDLPFDMIGIGMGIAVVIIAVDLVLARYFQTINYVFPS
jgi:uncharacterized oligopeptide transporter (OPT) family protein